MRMERKNLKIYYHKKHVGYLRFGDAKSPGRFYDFLVLQFSIDGKEWSGSPSKIIRYDEVEFEEAMA